jgi:hypothetical protein
MWLGAALPQVRRGGRAEMIHRAADRLAREHDPALGEPNFDITKVEAKSKIEPDPRASDLGRKMISGIAILT